MDDNGTETAPDPHTIEGVREINAHRENRQYPQEVREMARTLWLSGWTDARIAKALGVARRETVTGWAGRENWHAARESYRQKLLDETTSKAAERKAELNAQYIAQAKGVLARLYGALTDKALEARSMEGTAFAAARWFEMLREMEGLAEGRGIIINNQVTVNAQTDFRQALSQVRGNPDRVREMMYLQREKLLVEARMRSLLAEPLTFVDGETVEE